MVNPRAQIELPRWLGEQYPFIPYERRTRGGALMRYLDEGGLGNKDEAVLMVHGNPTWSFYYRRAVQVLSARLRCIVPDHIGMGLSEKPEGYPYVLAQRITDIEELVAELGLRKVHLIVHDWGGAIGMGWAVRHPEQVGNIVILNTAAFRSKRMPLRIAACRWPFVGKIIVRGLNGFAGPATRMAMYRTTMTPAVRRAYLWPYNNWKNRVGVHAFVRDIPMKESHESHGTLLQVEKGLESLSGKRMSIFWGGEDFCFNRSFYDEWLRRFPGAHHHYLKGIGHYVMEDADERMLGELIRSV